MSERARAVVRQRNARGKLRAYFDLTKPRITLLVVVVEMGAFCIASPGSVGWLRLSASAAGTVLLAFGVFALNHFRERDTDALMLRTVRRPLPSGRLTAREALVFGAVLTAGSVAGIALVFGLAAGAVAFLTFVSYIFVYTPLKGLTMHHTVPGAVSGAMPPLLGWACARGDLGLEAWILFGILFFWQFPHFLSLELLYNEDYQRGGIRVVTAIPSAGAWIVAEIAITASLLVGVSLVPFFIGMAGPFYLAGAAIAGSAYAFFAARAAVLQSKPSGRSLLRASVIYLPVLFLLLVANAR